MNQLIVNKFLITLLNISFIGEPSENTNDLPKIAPTALLDH